ncbi:hypothetical protein QE419_000908 [Brevundimonas vesicularis]|uniref:P-loop NTPase fold protein n=1 Tax=Brevundimonas vesicularis TaxID=41276 RepID=UPI0027814670|nr:P-loop NTPase fold protein [Brevundimonas vesicularis]MDQ1192142.1 hypothetical protein [Brevundimonas vesicularis]
MAISPWPTVRVLIAETLLSPAIVQLLDVASPSRHSRSRSTCDISSYVEQVVSIGLRQTGTSNAFVVEQLSTIIPVSEIRGALRNDRPGGREMVLSDGLGTVFAEAFALRAQTGGQDDWIGARHILACLLTSGDRDVITELALAIEPFGRLDLRPLLHEVASLVAEALEPGEDAQAWRRFFTERGYPEAGARLPRLERPSDETAPLQREAGADLVADPISLGSQGDAERRRSPPLSEGWQIGSIAAVVNDDVNAVAFDGFVGSDRLASALAHVLASKAFAPPLAVGVFGPWGSGKSLMMRRIQNEITRVAQSADPAYSPNVVDIRFNAWHYVDTDLWANLVGTIFEALDRHAHPASGRSSSVLDGLTTARELTLASASELAASRRSADSAQAALSQAESALRKQRSSLATAIKGTDAGLTAFSAEIGRDADANALVNSTYGQTLASMAAEWETPAAAIDAMKQDGAVWLSIWRKAGRKRTLLIVLVSTLALAFTPYVGILLAAGADGLSEMKDHLNPIVTAASAFVVASGSCLAWLTRKAVIARDAVVAAITAYHKAANGPSDAGKRLAEARDAVSLSETKVEEARAALDHAIRRQAAAANAFASESPGERLKAFVRSRAAIDGPYRSREGLIATIRRDFSDLSALMAGQDERISDEAEDRRAAYAKAVEDLKARNDDALTAGELCSLDIGLVGTADGERFDRIVLYVDDLDRCPDQTVIDVLQAVHLLMAFPLFVVVVAVDVRWLESALRSRHAQLEAAEAPGTGTAGAREYLEKIFQLVVWTEPLAQEDIRIFLQRRLVGDAVRSPSIQHHADGRVEGSTDQPEEHPDRVDRSAQAPAPPPVTATDRPAPPVPPVFTASALRISDDEIDAMERACRTLTMTPRRMARFANSYQVARASLNEADSDHLAQRGYPALIAYLALSIALPDCALIVTRALQNARDWTTFDHFLSGTAAASDLRLMAWRTDLDSSGLAPEALSRYRQLVLRLSFTGAA